MNQQPEQESIAFLVVDLSRLIRQAFDRAVAEHGLELTAGEARTLYYLARNQSARQSDLAKAMRVEPMTLSNYLDRLEARGLAERRPAPNDRRSKCVFLTPAAEPVVARIRDVAASVRRTATRDTAPDDIERTRRTIERMRANLGDSGAE